MDLSLNLSLMFLALFFDILSQNWPNSSFKKEEEAAKNLKMSEL
jgi:hypothetical protein